MAVTTQTWRTLSLVFAVTTVLAWWQACKTRATLTDERAARDLDRALAEVRPGTTAPAPGDDSPRTHADGERAASGDRNGPPVTPVVKLPTEVGALAAAFAPLPDETMFDYRDRILPVAEQLLAPQRARVQRDLDRFADEAGLDAEQRAALDQTVRDTADRLRERVIQGVMNGEVMPPWRPTSVVGFGRDVLDILDQMAHRFRDSLTPAQRDALDAGRFDPIDYLAFSTRWEEMLGVDP